MKDRVIDEIVVEPGHSLFYERLPVVREDGVCGTLIGYRKNGETFWYE